MTILNYIIISHGLEDHPYGFFSGFIFRMINYALWWLVLMSGDYVSKWVLMCLLLLLINRIEKKWEELQIEMGELS